MDAISPKDVRNLLQETAPPRVSIYMPTFRLEERSPQNRIRLKNLLDEAGRRLERDGGLRSVPVKELPAGLVAAAIYRYPVAALAAK